LALGNILTGATILLGLLFSSHILHADESLVAQWANYINPFNNLFLYCAGIALYYNARNWQFSKPTSLVCFAVPLLLFAFYPAQGD
jgi:exopolysaccharide production protein ExoZ